MDSYVYQTQQHNRYVQQLSEQMKPQIVTRSTHKKQKKVKKLVVKDYKHEERSLNLFGEPLWANIINFQGKDWTHVRQLDVGACGILDQQLKTIFDKNWPQLNQLHLWSNQISWMGITKLLNMKLQHLKILNLDQNKICSIGAKILVRMNFPQLETLSIKCCQLNDEGVKSLSKGNWPNLKQIRIWENYIQTGGVEGILLGNWKKLNNIVIELKGQPLCLCMVLLNAKNLFIDYRQICLEKFRKINQIILAERFLFQALIDEQQQFDQL